MTPPRLTFFCELDSKSLEVLIDDQLIANLIDLNASLSIGILDFNSERARVVRRLNQAGVPLIAWLLLPEEQGYWFNLGNVSQAVSRYADFKRWTAEHGLQWARVGLDIEPDISELKLVSTNKLHLISKALGRAMNRKMFKEARVAYQDLVARIRADGYAVDSYQFPLIADERKAGSTLLQRLGGLVDIPADREVWMVYTSTFRPHGAAILCSYAAEAQSVGLGVTGGGVEIDFVDHQPLTWEEFARDLRLTWYWSEDIHIFSLEGCVQQGFLERLKTFTWDNLILLPQAGIVRVNSWRNLLRSGLWLSAHTTAILVVLLGSILLWKGVNRYLRRRLNNKG